jgi:A/G-specific adenine glycosylase
MSEEPTRSELEIRSEEIHDLLTWYDQRRRDLPWRRTTNPYPVWVSEIMLQQTRVATALPYFETFLERFPTVHDLAAADVDEVLALWSGLGYYRRARQMHAAARQVVADGGHFPETSEGLLQLPGIGPYTAAAVASICFDEVIPVMDGNVERVLARRLALPGDVKRAATRRRLVEAAANLLDGERPGDSNQALMELGATVCTPRSPRCDDCPVATGCLGRDEPERFPEPRKKRKLVEVTKVVAVVRGPKGSVLLFRRRDDHELMAGLWELPQVEISSGSTALSEITAEEITTELAKNYGAAWRLEDEVCRVKHGITHRSITLRVHPATLVDSGEVADAQGSRPEPAWVDWQSDGDRFATSSMVQKVLSALARSEP